MISFRTSLFAQDGTRAGSKEEAAVTEALEAFKQVVDAARPILNRASYSDLQWMRKRVRRGGHAAPAAEPLGLQSSTNANDPPDVGDKGL